MAENKTHYVYLTTNLITGEQYVGDHTISIKEKKYYQGSGKYLFRAIKKYGEQNFFKEILEWFKSRQEAFDAQEKYIIQFNTLVPQGYNISPKGGLCVRGCHSEETKIRMGKAQTGNHYWLGKSHTEETKQIMRKPKKSRDGYRESKIGEKNPMYGKSLYHLWVEKYGIEDANTRNKALLDKRIGNTNNLNKKWSDESKKKFRENRLIRNKSRVNYATAK